MNKDDLIRFLKENNITSLTFTRNQYKGLDNNSFHWDTMHTGDLYIYSKVAGSDTMYRLDTLTKVKEEEYDNSSFHVLEDLCAWYVEDMDLVLFMGSTLSDLEESDMMGTYYSIPERLFAIFTVKELIDEGIFISIDYRED